MNKAGLPGEPRCFLCGLHSEYLTRISGEGLCGISCKRCGEYYLDHFSAECGVTEKPSDKALISGYIKWENALKHSAPIIHDKDIERIIEANKEYPEIMKVDKLLIYYSNNYPKKGALIEFIAELDYPVTFSNEMNEFVYILEKLAFDLYGFIDLKPMASPPQGYFQITPKGWERINWIGNFSLADRKYQIESEKIYSGLKRDEANRKEQAGLNGIRISSVLARELGEIYLAGSLKKLDTKLSIDTEIILKQTQISTTEDINYLLRRIKELAEREKDVFSDELRRTYKDCKADSFIETALSSHLKSIDNKVEEIEIDLKTGKLPMKEAGKAENERKKMASGATNPKKVFVVHGRNEKAREALFLFLRAVGLEPIEWGQAIMATGRGSPYIGEILEKAFSEAQAVVVLFTGDDIAKIRDECLKPDDPDYEKSLTPQARLNVIFEAGMAFGTHEERTILVELANEKIRPFSDVYGRHVVKISNSTDSRLELINRLRTAKCDIDIEGRKDWVKFGDFEAAASACVPNIPTDKKE